MTPAALAQTGLTLADLERLLYEGVEGYNLATLGRDRRQCHTPDFTYGEVTPDVISTLLAVTNARPGEVFYDLGAGTGKAVLYAAALGELSKAVGIELLEELHQGSVQAHQRFVTDILPRMPHKQDRHVEMRLGDITTEDISDGDIVFTHCTCFTNELMDAVARQCATMKSGSRIVTVSKALPITGDFVLIEQAPCQMAWGSATLHIHRRV